MAVKFICLYFSYLEEFSGLNDAQFGRLVRAGLRYANGEGVPELSGKERLIFPTLKFQIDESMKKYDTRCRTNKRNSLKALSAKRLTPIASDRIRSVPRKNKNKNENKNNNENENDNVNVSKDFSSVAEKSLFTPPSAEQVRIYCEEEKLSGVDAAEFTDYYTANGWLLGKTRIRDWKSVVRLWNMRASARAERESAGAPAKKPRYVSKPMRKPTEEEELAWKLLLQEFGEEAP